MAYIDNNETIKELKDAIRGNSVSNVAPNNVSGVVTPVFDINPKSFRVTNIVRRSTVSTTLYTTPTDRDFYLFGYYLDLAHNIAAQSGNITITCTPKGGPQIVIGSLSYATTALIDRDSKNSFVWFEKPILLERNTTIFTDSTGTAAIGRQYVIFGQQTDAN